MWASQCNSSITWAQNNNTAMSSAQRFYAAQALASNASGVLALYIADVNSGTSVCSSVTGTASRAGDERARDNSRLMPSWQECLFLLCISLNVHPDGFMDVATVINSTGSNASFVRVFLNNGVSNGQPTLGLLDVTNTTGQGCSLALADINKGASRMVGEVMSCDRVSRVAGFFG